MVEFVHLHVHSEYSLLDGLSSCPELAERAVELGMPSLALTDHGTMYGAIQFYKACRAAGIRPLIGLETYIARRDHRERGDAQQDRKPHHLILLAQNDTGYHNLMRLATIAQLEGFYYKPRVDKETLAGHADGLIVLSGCGSSEVYRLIQDGQLDAARQAIAWYRDTFPGRYYLEVQEHDLPEMTRVNRQMFAFAREFGLPLAATNDVHYTRREQASIHDVLLCIQTGKTANEPNRMRMDSDSYYLRSAEEMAALFPEVPEALTNTLRIAEMCELELEFGHYHLPPFEVPEGHDAQSYLRHLCEAGLQRRYAEVTPEVRQRLDYELDIIHRMGFDTYFLIVWDLCRFCRERGIWWNVRGSGAGSIVAYSLGITNLEPLQHGLIFERFLNLGRVTMPDIDLDFPDDQRDQLIRYTVEKYGQEQVAQIITFGTLGAKAAIRDVGRALDYPLSEVDRVARLVPAGPKVKLERSLQEVPELKEQYEAQEHIRRLIDTAKGVEGNVRHASTHAAGVIISDIPLVNYTPLHRPTRGGESDEIGVVTQYSMDELGELGLLKIDFLGLSTLTIMRRACELIRQRHGVPLDLDTIPTHDPAIYELLSRGDVMGIFQVEGQGMRRVLMKMQPTQFDHIIATISLFRPGPMEYIDDYIDRMHGLKPVEYRHPSLEPILRETYATLVYQEQIIRILTDIAGYQAGDADLVRRAVGHKIKAELLKHRASFIEGAVKHGRLPEEIAAGIFDDIEYFARYGFNKSHAADYAVLTCQTAYLKAKYPVEYMTALLSVERNNTEKVGLLIAECRRMGIEVLPPDINTSGLDFTIEEQADDKSAIRFGLGAVKNVGEGPVGTILAARQAGGPFHDLEDFCRRVDLRQVNRRALESLIKVGALRPFSTRSQLLSTMDRIIGLSASLHHAQDVGQISLFGEATGVRLAAEDTLLPPLSSANEVPHKNILAWEKELVGVYISEHPLAQVLVRLQDVVTATAGALGEEKNGQQVTVAGMVQRVRRHVTKRGAEMAFVTLEDLQGTCDVVVFPQTWSKTKDLWEPERILVVVGKVDAGQRDTASLLCDWAKTPDEVAVPAEQERPKAAAPQPPPPPPPGRLESPPHTAPGRLESLPHTAPGRLESSPHTAPGRLESSPHTAPGRLESLPHTAPPPARTVCVTLTRSGKQAEDVQTLRQVHGLLVEHPGPDRFIIRLTGGTNGPVELAFPNDTTRYSPELEQQLKAVLGPDALHLESAG